jgi:hypothetical protein
MARLLQSLAYAKLTRTKVQMLQQNLCLMHNHMLMPSSLPLQIHLLVGLF